MSTKSYVIWNNKGGVGKSTITFHIATVYAQKNPAQDVVLIDMCPQANSSMMILGGVKSGEQELQKLIADTTPRTVVVTFRSRTSNPPLKFFSRAQRWVESPVHLYNFV